MASKHRIPVVIVAGFLGSGKTTLLNHLLHHSGGTRVGVVVNDFGAINIDALAVAGQVDSMISLGNGCLCCAVDTSDLDSMLARLTRPQARIDVVVIEASGIAEPQEVIRMVLASGNERIAYGGLVQVVDAAEFDATRARHPQVERHLRLADLVVVNKSDRVEPEVLREAAATVGRLGDGVPVLTTSHGRVDPELLFDARARTEEDAGGAGRWRQLSFEDLVGEGGAEHGDGGHEDHVHAQYDSVEFESRRPLHPRRLMDFLDKRPAGPYRIKGTVYFGVPGHRQKFTLHTVGGYLRFQRARWAGGEERVTRLVLIGTGIDAEAVREGLRGCVETERAGGAGAAAGEQDMMAVLRFVS